MRFKFYLRGCGLGILFATIVLAVGFGRSGKKELTDFEIMQRASELGMVMQFDEAESGAQEEESQSENTEIEE